MATLQGEHISSPHSPSRPPHACLCWPVVKPHGEPKGKGVTDRLIQVSPQAQSRAGRRLESGSGTASEQAQHRVI